MVCALGLRAQGPLDMPQKTPLSFPKSNLRTRNQNPNPQLPLFPKIEPEDQKSESKSSTSADSAPLNPNDCAVTCHFGPGESMDQCNSRHRAAIMRDKESRSLCFALLVKLHLSHDAHRCCQCPASLERNLYLPPRAPMYSQRWRHSTAKATDLCRPRLQ